MNALLPPSSPCPLCGAVLPLVLGIRGNREYNGADPRREPHLVTNVVRCGRCDYFYADPPIPESAELERGHYADAQTYQAAPRDASRMFAARLAFLESAVRPGAILDVGCGKGEFLAEARRRGWSPSGLEPSEGLREHARGLGIEAKAGTLDDHAPFVPRSFDAVSFNHVLEHIADPVGALRRARALLRPGGAVFIEVPNCDANLLRLADLYFRLLGLGWSSRLSPVHPPFHSRGFSRASLAFALRAAGLGVVEMRTWSGADRGFARRGARPTPSEALRDGACALLGLAGNRELLAAVARPVEGEPGEPK